MKVLLIQPAEVAYKSYNIITNLTNFSYRFIRSKTPPIGIAYLASTIEKAGHTVKIIDSTVMNYRLRHIKREIKRFNPDVVGVTAMTTFIYDALEVLKLVKKLNPNCLTVLGGPHPTVQTKEILNEVDFVDVIVRGEGEKTLLELIEKSNFEKIDGISYKENNKIIENKNRELIKDLDSIPFPAYHLLPMHKYQIKLADIGVLGGLDLLGHPYGAIVTSRGCPFNCNFCAARAIWGNNWRGRSPENIVEELKLLREEYGIRKISFMDDLFTVDKKRVIKTCELIKKEDLDISWFCLSRVDSFNKEIAESLKSAGCFRVWFGIESGTQETLNLLNKTFKLEDSKKAVKITKDAGLDAAGFFMIGIPGETKEMMEKTIAFANKLHLSTSIINLFIPYPGTKFYEIADQQNLILSKDWSKYHTNKSLMKIPGFTAHQLEKMWKKAHLSFNLSNLKS